MSTVNSALNVQIADGARVGLDELPARGHLVAHEHVKDFISHDRVLELHLQDSPGDRIHGGLPELLRVHLAETFVTLDVDLTAATKLLVLVNDLITLRV